MRISDWSSDVCSSDLQAGWSELIDHVRTGHWSFAGGALWVDATPAMLLIDIDGEGDALVLAQAGAREAAGPIRRCAIGGSIGIVFPPVPGRARRQAVCASLAAGLQPPFDRTHVNRFGFLQLPLPPPTPSPFPLYPPHPPPP